MSRPVITVRPDTSVKQVAALLVQQQISAVPVVDDAGRLVGIVSQADLVPRHGALQSRGEFEHVEQLLDFLPRTAADVMTRAVLTVPEDADVTQAARIMLDEHVKQVPVVRDGKVVGIISRRDLLRPLARSDAEIRAEVAALLDDELLGLGKVAVAMLPGGVVHLSGLTEPWQRRLAEVLAASVPGVTAVVFAEPPHTTRRG
jgi:CBS domain-containing protein